MEIVFESRFRPLLLKKSANAERRITLADVSEATGIPIATLNRIASNPNNVTLKNFAPLCRYFGVQMNELTPYIDDEQKQTTGEGA